MSLFDSFKSAIFEDDPNKQTPAAQSPVHAPSLPLPGATLPAAAVPNEFVVAIKKVVFSRNTALAQLMQASDKLANIIPMQRRASRQPVTCLLH